MARKPTLAGVLVLVLLLGLVWWQGQGPVPDEDAPLLEGQEKNIEKEFVQDGIYFVEEVIDGDTIYIETDDGDSESVRLIGINTPETVDPRTEVECFGKEASIKTTELLQDQEVRIEFDPAKGDRDQFGRLLRYVFLPGQTNQSEQNINKLLIEQGFAYENSYGVPYKFEKEFKQAQIQAKNSQAGLWAPGVCAK